MQHWEHMRLDARRESNQSMNAKRQVEQNPAILQWKISRWSGFTFWASSTPFLFTWSSALLPSVFHAISTNQQTCREHQRWWPGATWRVVALNWRLSKQKRQKKNQILITDLAILLWFASSYLRNMQRVTTWWKRLLLLPWDLDGSFTKSMAVNASAPVLGKIWVSMCFVLNTKIILLKSWSKKFQPRNTQLYKKHKPLNGFKTGVEEVQFWMRVIGSKLMLRWVQHQGTSRASLRRAPDARRDPPVQDARKYHGLLTPLALTKGTWHLSLF